MQEAKKKKNPAENMVSPFFRVLPCKVNICAEGWTTPVHQPTFISLVQCA